MKKDGLAILIAGPLTIARAPAIILSAINLCGNTCAPALAHAPEIPPNRAFMSFWPAFFYR
jgi:hypothetical protein